MPPIKVAIIFNCDEWGQSIRGYIAPNSDIALSPPPLAGDDIIAANNKIYSEVDAIIAILCVDTALDVIAHIQGEFGHKTKIIRCGYVETSVFDIVNKSGNIMMPPITDQPLSAYKDRAEGLARIERELRHAIGLPYLGIPSRARKTLWIFHI